MSSPTDNRDKPRKKKKKPKKADDDSYIGKSIGGDSKEKRAARDKLRQQGAFVYQGSGKKHGKNADLSEKKCEKQTIELQWCLAKNDHKQDKCEGLVEIWRACKDKWDARDPKLK